MVDEPPAALWVMGLSARLFGVTPGAMLAPQALMGVFRGRVPVRGPALGHDAGGHRGSACRAESSPPTTRSPSPRLIAALVAVGVVALHRPGDRPALTTLAASAAPTAGWCWSLRRGTPTFLPWLRAVVLVGGLACAAVLLVVAWRGGRGRLARRVTTGVVAATVLFGLAAPAVYALQAAATAHEGALPSAGPPSTARPSTTCRPPGEAHRARAPHAQLGHSSGPRDVHVGARTS